MSTGMLLFNLWPLHEINMSENTLLHHYITWPHWSTQSYRRENEFWHFSHKKPPFQHCLRCDQSLTPKILCAALANQPYSLTLSQPIFWNPYSIPYAYNTLICSISLLYVQIIQVEVCMFSCWKQLFYLLHILSKKFIVQFPSLFYILERSLTMSNLYNITNSGLDIQPLNLN